MNLAVRGILIALFVFSVPPRSFAQGNAELIEDIKRLAGEVADLRDANTAQSRRIVQMQKEIDSLRDSAREAHERATAKMGDFATRDDLKKIVDNIRDVDQKREADRKLILEEVEKLGKTLSQPVDRPERTGNGRKNRDRDKDKDREPDKDAAPIEGTFLPYKVKDGQRLSDILKEYNGALKSQGLAPVTIEQVRRANPKIKNINNIFTGQEILLPVPEKKK